MESSGNIASQVIEIASEGIKSVIREVFHLGYNRVDSVSAGVLHIVQSPFVYYLFFLCFRTCSIFTHSPRQ